MNTRVGPAGCRESRTATWPPGSRATSTQLPPCGPLRRPIGSVEILRDQLRYLLSLSSRPNLTLQITPLGMGGHATPSGFSILRFGEPDLPDIAYLEHLTSALYFDKKSDVDRYLLAMERLSIISAKPSETPGILATILSQLED